LRLAKERYMNVTFAPSTPKRALVIAGGVAFTALGVFMLVSGPSVVEVVGAVLCIVFFGGGTVAFIVKLSRTTTALVLSPQGLHPMSGGLVPWEDYEGVGLGRVSGTLVIGIRLRSYDSYIASLTPEQATVAARAGTVARLFGAATRSLTGRGHAGSASLAKIPSSKEGLAGLLAWTRQTSGYDLTFSPMMFDRPAIQVVQAIAEYQAASLS
jgi:hypothetical protein